MRSARLAGALLFVGAFALYTSTIAHHYPAPDERCRFDLARAIAERGPGVLKGTGGGCRYPPLTSFVAVPFIKALSPLDHAGDDAWTRRAGAFANVTVTALCVALFFAVLLQLGHSLRTATLASALYAVANPLWPYTKRFYSEPVSALLVLA